jgi:hypothetical protein
MFSVEPFIMLKIGGVWREKFVRFFLPRLLNWELENGNSRRKKGLATRGSGLGIRRKTPNPPSSLRDPSHEPQTPSSQKRSQTKPLDLTHLLSMG